MSALNGENSGSRGTSFDSESNIYSSNELHVLRTCKNDLSTPPSVQISQPCEKVAPKTTMVPQITTSTLNRADGSATYTDSLFSVLAAVNGPVEVSRRDELPEESTIEVNIRPGSGVGGPRERWLETVLHSLMRSIVLVHLHPRTLVQVTLQVVREPGIKFTKGRGEVAILPTRRWLLWTRAEQLLRDLMQKTWRLARVYMRWLLVLRAACCWTSRRADST
jgi:hypothetical protein